MGVRTTALPIFSLGMVWLSSQIHMPVGLFPRNNTSSHSVWGWVRARANLGNFDRRKACCICRDSNAGSSIPWSSHVTNRYNRLSLQSVSFGTGWSCGDQLFLWNTFASGNELQYLPPDRSPGDLSWGSGCKKNRIISGYDEKWTPIIKLLSGYGVSNRMSVTGSRLG